MGSPRVYADETRPGIQPLERQDWHREIEWMNLFAAACGPPARAA